MLEALETLIALKKYKTMSQASNHLRVSQSAVSKRIATLEQESGKKLTQKDGRNIKLTEDALILLEKVSPHIGEIREALNFKLEKKAKTLVLGVAESILSSWGPKKIKPLFKSSDLDLELHCHRSPLVIEKIESGFYDAGLCAGKISTSRSIHSELIMMEEMVLISKVDLNLKKETPITCIEESSTTWKAIKADIQTSNLAVTNKLESFFSIAQMAKSGLCTGLVSIGVANALNIKDSMIFKPKKAIRRPIQIVFKKSKLENDSFKNFLKDLSK